MTGTVLHCSGKYMASITYNGKYHYLGLFETQAEAHKVWKAERKKHPDRRFKKNRNGA